MLYTDVPMTGGGLPVGRMSGGLNPLLSLADRGYEYWPYFCC